MPGTSYVESTLFKGTVEEMRDAMIEMQRDMAKQAQTIQSLEAKIAQLEMSVKDGVKEGVIEGIQPVVAELQRGNDQRNTQIEQSDKIIKLDYYGLMEQRVGNDIARESTLMDMRRNGELTQEQMEAGVINTQTFFETHGTPKAIRDAEFEKAMSDLGLDLDPEPLGGNGRYNGGKGNPDLERDLPDDVIR